MEFSGAVSTKAHSDPQGGFASLESIYIRLWGYVIFYSHVIDPTGIDKNEDLGGCTSISEGNSAIWLTHLRTFYIHI